MAFALIFLTSCGEEDFTFSGAYWNENPQNTSVSGIKKEVLTYQVSSSSTAVFSSSEVSSEGLSLVVDEKNSSYETTLTVDGEFYVYETTLKIKGKYVYGGGEYQIENDYTYTKTVFKGLDERLFPISSEKKAENVFVAKETPSSAADFGKVSYEMQISYGETADIKITPGEGSERLFKKTEFSLKDYKKKTFLDDGEMIFAFRAVKFAEDTEVFEFNTIDGFTGEIKGISVEAMKTQTSVDSDAQVVIPIRVKQYWDNGRLLDIKDFSCYGVSFNTTGNYGKAFRYVYYAVNTINSNGEEINTTNHVPVMIVQPETYNTGYLCFTLEKFSATYK